MGLNALSIETRGFLRELFDSVSRPVRFGDFEEPESTMAAKASFQFGNAVGGLIKGEGVDEINARITLIKEALECIQTAPLLKNTLEQMKAIETDIYSKASPQVKAELGSYSAKFL
ncbi:MAG: hypothetical protein ACAH80_03365 [Alphaproteobacteria bacterium]